ncbi:hypothetical protein BH11ACT8_BH11ACT8_23570 [soil metagenome]
MFQTVAIVISLALTAVAVVLVTQTVRRMVGVMKIGQPAVGRTDQPMRRTVTMLKETFGHTRMLQWTWVGIMHWFVYLAFIILSTAVANAYVQLFDPSFVLPIVGHWYPVEWVLELIGLLSTVGIVFLILYRQKHHPRSLGRKSRFFGSTMWQAYFVEAFALLEGGAILFIRGAEYKLIAAEGELHGGRGHFPLASVLGDVLYPDGVDSLKNIIYAVAVFKIVLAMVWLIVIARNITMGIAWHRFSAWPNIWFKRESSGRTALGAIKPLTSEGRVITLDDIDDLDEDTKLGVGAVEDFSWKGILDFTTCTECGRCQSQCPAWNTEKPLSPKLLITALRDATYAKAEYLMAPEGERETLLENNPALRTEVERPLIGDTGDDWFYNPPSGAAVIDPEVLWNCTSCGACVQQCPVDIEHVDHIMDMRRHAILVESNFPSELNGLFKGLENKGNPWNMSASARMDWAKGLEFDVKVVGEDLESLDSVDWLFWVGCAGAYEDRAKKTTRAVAELLDMAGVSFGVLGNGETCTGDPARRAGNEFVFQGLAQQNAETFKEFKVKKVVSTCAHCFNTLKNEYQAFGVELEVVHHTQLLNRLVREGRLTPVKDGAGAAKRSITYHDPCYIGRHNGVYTPPRELLEILPGAEFVEMERNSERSFCCGAGGARMWMEENIGERININRTKEAVGTGADQIAVGCPFCRVMLSDGLTMQQSKGEAREEVEVLDIAQMLLASVKGEQATKLAPGSSANGAEAPAAKQAEPTEKSTEKPAEKSVETKAEPDAGDVTTTEDPQNTVTETADAGPAAKASGGSSLFDDAADETPETATEGKAPAEEARAAKPASSGGSLFDVGDEADEKPAESTAEPTPAEPAATEPAATGSTTEAKPAEDLGSGGSLFDLGGDQPEPTKAEPTPEAEPEAEKEPAPAPAEPVEAAPEPDATADAEPEADVEPAADLGGGGSLFDIAAAEPAAKAEPAPAEEKPAEPAAATPEPEPAADLGGGGSLFDIASPQPAAQKEPEPTPAPPVEAAPEPEEKAEDTQAEPAEATPEPTSEPTSEPAAKAAPAPTPSAEIPEGGSLFDIVAPEPAAPAAKAQPDPEPEPEPVAEEPEEEPAAESAGAALSTAATAAVADEATTEPPAAETKTENAEVDAEAEPEADPEPEPDEDDAPAAEEKPAPTSNGEAHQPRTDVDFDEVSSLFDI